MPGDTNPANAGNFASFPNSRNSSRSSTKTSDTYALLAKWFDNGLDLPVAGGFDTVANEPAEINRGDATLNGNTILIEKNRTRTYTILRNVDSSEGIVYGYVDRDDLETTGMILRAGDTVELDNKNAIYIRSIATDSSDIECRVDFGLG